MNRNLRLVFGILVVVPFTLGEVDADHPAYVPHGPVVFRTSTDFGVASACLPNLANGVIGGCGTSANPWRIEGWHFAATPIGVVTTSALTFLSTSDHVLIQDNQFTLGGGVRIESAQNIQVNDNTFSQATGLILADGFGNPSSSIRFTNNVVVSISDGVTMDGQALSKANGITISGNTLTGSTQAAVELGDVTGVTITGNTITGNKDGIICPFGGCGGVTISNNDISGNTGVAIRGSWNGRVLNNDIRNNAHGIQGDICSLQPGLAGNNIVGNTNYGLRLLDCNLDARNNWWGDASGPSGVGPGTGDEIELANSATVVFDPWLTAANPNAGP